MALTCLALVLKVIIPQGFMVGDRAGSFPLVICTGHGPMGMAGESDGGKAPTQKKSDAPCAFAGNVTPIAPSDISTPSQIEAVAIERRLDVRLVDLMPGRGLAAPPPQSHAPPAVSI